MNERIKELAEQANKKIRYKIDTHSFKHIDDPDGAYTRVEFDKEKFAELIVQECMTIAKTWEDQLENANSLSESNAVGIVAYRIARQFGVRE